MTVRVTFKPNSIGGIYFPLMVTEYIGCNFVERRDDGILEIRSDGIVTAEVMESEVEKLEVDKER